MSDDPGRRQALESVAAELSRACDRFPAFNSPHEGWAVIREELDELWDHVRGNTGRGPEARKEAIQIAAMALRYVIDCASDERERQRFVDDALHRLEGSNR